MLIYLRIFIEAIESGMLSSINTSNAASHQLKALESTSNAHQPDENTGIGVNFRSAGL